jgi:hypothetical protein
VNRVRVPDSDRDATLNQGLLFGALGPTAVFTCENLYHRRKPGRTLPATATVEEALPGSNHGRTVRSPRISAKSAFTYCATGRLGATVRSRAGSAATDEFGAAVRSNPNNRPTNEERS